MFSNSVKEKQQQQSCKKRAKQHIVDKRKLKIQQNNEFFSCI